MVGIGRKVVNDKGSFWMQADFGQTLYNHNNIPNGHTCTNNGAYFEGAWTASSRHRSGVNVVFGDGHIFNIKTTININMWRSIGTRDGGELISTGDL
jgi:prepilin-type processing-associated H-X9-DG protein